MHISLEAANQHAVQSYSDDKIQIDSVIYEKSLIVSKKEIISDLAINRIDSINENYLELLLRTMPELIIIGHNQIGIFPPMRVMTLLSEKRIGLECMSIGAACRTFNVLLSEERNVVAAFLI